MQISPKNRLQQPLHRRKSTYLHVKQWLVSSTKWRIAGVSLLVIVSILLGNQGKSQASNNAIPLLQPTLFADWGMNNDGTDSSGNGRTLTLTGGASYTDTFIAEGTHALDLAGGYASAPTMTVPSEFSISSWVRIPITLTQIQTIIGTDTASIFTAGFKLYINEYGTSNGKIAFETGVGESRTAATTAENTFTFGQWNHIVAVVNRTAGVVSIYYNGTKVLTNGATLTDINLSAAPSIGAFSDGQYSLYGQLDAVRIYAGLLTDAELDFVQKRTLTS